MSKFDFTSLDGKSLKTLLAILEEGSISDAAARLGVTQSAVSHTLEKLRLILGDPLFVRQGRGVVPTEQALSLMEPVQQILDNMKALTDRRPFDPVVGTMEFTIAANDFQRDLIFPGLLKHMLAKDIDVRFRFVPSGIPATDLLRQNRCQLIVTPMPPDGVDIYQTRLFDDHVVCFYDATQRKAPKKRSDFEQADYIDVRFEEAETTTSLLRKTLDLNLVTPRVTVPNFAALGAFLRDSTLVSLQLSMLERVNLEGLASCPVPSPDTKLTMFMVWHRRDHHDPAHQWLREQIKRFCEILDH